MKSNSDQRILSITKRIAGFSGGISLVVGFIVLFGWETNNQGFKSLIPGYVSMRPLTALAFLFAGVALLSLREEIRRVAVVRIGFIAAGILAVIGGIVLAQYAFQLDFGVDRWMFRDAVLQEGGLYPGRPAPASAFGLFLLGLSSLTLRRRSAWLTNGLSIPVFIIGLLAVVGYIFDASALYRIEPYVPMALHTALLLLGLGLGCLCAFPGNTLMGIFTEDLVGSISARRLVPAALLVPIIVGWLDLQGERLGLYGAPFNLALFATMTITALVGLGLVTAQSLNRAELHRRAALDALGRMEVNYRTIVEQTPAVVYVDEIGGKWRYLSPQIERILGYKAEDWLADPDKFKSRVHADDLGGMERQVHESTATGAPYSSEFRFLTSDDRMIWLHDEAVVVRDDATGKTLHQGVMYDITDRKLAEAQLLYQARLLENVNDAIIATDENFTLTAWNPAAEKMYGWKAAEVIGKKGVDLLKTEFPAAEPAEMRHQINEIGQYVGEASQLRKDGRRIQVDVASIVLKDQSRGITGYVSVNRDITDRKQAEEKLRESEERYRMLVEQLPAAVYVNPASDINVTTYVSPQIESMLGYTQKEWLEDPKFWSKVLHEYEKARVAASVARAERSHEKFDVEYRISAKDGRTVWIHDQAVLLRDSKGTPLLWQGLMIDLTERKMAEREREAKVALEARNAELDRFAYTVSHDLKSPLVTIRGFITFLRTDLAAGNMERVQEDLKRIDEAAGRMQDLLTGVLALSRAGLTIKKPEEVRMSELAGEAIALLQASLEAGNATVVIQPDLPIVLGDGLRLRQALQNLVENAVRYRSVDRPPVIEIGARGRDETGKIVLFVQDNGMGIPPGYHDRIFDLFGRVDPADEGGGIGLATVQRIVNAHGGRIWVESEEGKGSTFFFTLPPPVSDSVI